MKKKRACTDQKCRLLKKCPTRRRATTAGRRMPTDGARGDDQDEAGDSERPEEVDARADIGGLLVWQQLLGGEVPIASCSRKRVRPVRPSRPYAPSSLAVTSCGSLRNRLTAEDQEHQPDDDEVGHADQEYADVDVLGHDAPPLRSGLPRAQKTRTHSVCATAPRQLAGIATRSRRHHNN